MRYTWILLVFLISINLASASYISGDIYINGDGNVKFLVDTDVNPNIDSLAFNLNTEKLTGSTEMLTEKQKGIWTFLLNLENYDTILLDIHLPNSLKSIESIDGIDNIIDIQEKTISLIDSNKKLDFEVSYTIENSNNYLNILYILILLAVIILISYLYNKKNKEKDRLNHILPIINDNEKKIIELLMKKPMRQKDIRKKLDFPKASFSRYLVNLQNKKLIIVEGEGKNKIVRLK